MCSSSSLFFFFFFNDTATTEIYTLSLHDALPICAGVRQYEVLSARLPHQPRIAGVARETLAHALPQRLEHLRRAREVRSEEHTSELQSQSNLVCRLLLEKKKKTN